MTSKEIEANSFYYLLKRNNLGNGIQFKYQVSIYVYLNFNFNFVDFLVKAFKRKIDHF